MDIAKRIKERRVAAGMTQKQLADKLGMYTMMVSNYERGVNSPVRKLSELAAALGCKEADLVS